MRASLVMAMEECPYCGERLVLVEADDAGGVPCTFCRECENEVIIYGYGL
jgi:hypothetical protein